MVKKVEEQKKNNTTKKVSSNKTDITKKKVKANTTKKKIKPIKEEKKKAETTSDNSFSTIEVLVLIIMSVVVSLAIGSLITYNLTKGKVTKNNKHIEKFIKNYNYIIDNYYDDIDKNKLIDGAISGMLNSLGDEYSYLIDENSSDNFDIELEGEYQGIGIEIVNVDDKVVVYSVFEDSPADKAGLEVGDIIKKVDDMECNNIETSDISKYIRGSEKNEFKLIIERNEEEKEIIIKKELVTIKSVMSKTFEENNKKIGYIYISLFSNVSTQQFKEKLEELEKDNIDSLIIDVRDNSGGHLTTATSLISLFLDSNHVIYQTDTKGVIRKFYSSGKKTKKYPIIVLQNHNSASASEMLSAALKEEYGATVVGENSYGKGTVQELLELDNNAEYKITTKKWLTPKGNWINGKGVEPDVKISMNQEYYENPSEEKDNQLRTAIEEALK